MTLLGVKAALWTSGGKTLTWVAVELAAVGAGVAAVEVAAPPGTTAISGDSTRNATFRAMGVEAGAVEAGAEAAATFTVINLSFLIITMKINSRFDHFKAPLSHITDPSVMEIRLLLKLFHNQ